MSCFCTGQYSESSCTSSSSRLMSFSSCLVLPPLLNRAGQLFSVSPDGGSLSLQYVGFPFPLAHGHFPRASRVGFSLPSHLQCHERIGSVGFPLRYSPCSFDVLQLSGQQCTRTAALHPSVLLHSYQAADVSRLRTPWHLYLSLTTSSRLRTLRGRQARLPWSGPVIS